METKKGNLIMNKFKYYLVPVFGTLAAAAMAQEGDASFDPSTFLTSATTTMTTIVTGLGALLVAGLGIYMAFVGYRKVREALNKA